MKQAALAILAVLALSSCSNGSGASPADRTRVTLDEDTAWAEAAEEARASNAGLQGFEFKGAGEISGRQVKFNAYVSEDGKCAGKLKRPDYTVEFQHDTAMGEELYFKASKKYWLSVAGPTQGNAVASAVGDQWTLYPKASAAVTDLFVLCDFEQWAKYQTPDGDLAYENKGMKGENGLEFRGGKNTYAVLDAADPHRVWEWRSKQLDLKFKSFNEDAYPEAPSYFVDLTKSLGS